MTSKERQGISAVIIPLFLALTMTINITAASKNGKIAFTSDRDGNPEIYVMNPDGTGQVRLTNNTSVDDSPSWSPDGKKIAFVGQTRNGNYAIFIMRPDGSGISQVTELYDLYFVTQLSWSPDGRMIAFHDYSAVSGGFDIFIVGQDGTGRRDLTIDHPDGDLTPVWSPDGSKILFSRQASYGSCNKKLFTINIDGTDLTSLQNGCEDGFDEIAPDWSSAANKIVFTNNVWDFYDALYIADPDGTDRHLFYQCNDSLDAEDAKFSPDGKKIVFRCGGQNNTDMIMSGSADGSDFRILTTVGRNYSPSWQPLPATRVPCLTCGQD